MSDPSPAPPNSAPVTTNIHASVYEAVFRASLDGILIADDQMHYVDVNDAACEILGRNREEVVGKEVGAFMEFEADARKLWEKAQRTGSLRAEITLLRPDGESRLIEFA